MKLDHIERGRLRISRINMRAKGKTGAADLVPSVRARGILVPLLVRPSGDEDGYEIVAGRRRYLAAGIVAEEKGEDPRLPCAIIEAGDDAGALEASLIENFARLDPDEVTQWETFARLVKGGKSVEDIAATFGITERLVARILALGNLLPRIRTLYRQEQIDAATVRHLTMATKAQQKEWLTLYDSPESYAPTGQRLKEWLCGGELIATKAALFDPQLYNGAIVSDLFGEDSYFADPDLFWRLQREAVEAKRKAYLEQGWTGVEVIEGGYHFPRWEYEKRSRSRGGKVYILLSQRGDVEILEGLVSRRESAKEARHDSGAKAERPEVTSAMRTYLDLHRHAAVRARLVEHPAVALRLLLAHALASAGHWSVQVEPQRSDNAAIAESVEASSAETLFDEKRRVVLALLELDPEAPTVVGEGRRSDPVALFQRLLELSDDGVATVAAVIMGETLEAGGLLVDHVGSFLAVDMASLWQADQAFFELLRDKQVLTALVGELAGPEAAKANAGETGKVMKGIIRDCLAGENGRPRTEAWVPRWLRFPAETYRTPAVSGQDTEPTETTAQTADEAETENVEVDAEDAGKAPDDEANASPEAVAAE
ncbi:MAG TPA: ParB N-terminal domain-containing protein [Allosphingosinicella sp.]|jgi:ParB family chromosome partitioning protein